MSRLTIPILDDGFETKESVEFVKVGDEVLFKVNEMTNTLEVSFDMNEVTKIYHFLRRVLTNE